MSTLTTRAGKGSSLTNAELDANFNNLNNDKLETSAYTAADVLAKLLTVDGTGSGLDADLLDGQSSAYYTDIAARLGYTPLNAASYTAADVLAKLLTVDGSASNLDADTVDGVHLTGLVQTSRQVNTAVNSGLTGGGSLSANLSLAFDTTWGDARYLLATAYTANDILTKIKTVDGTGSGLDADTLDGQDSTYYTDIAARLGYTPVPNSRTLTAGTGLSGGTQDLTANRTISFDSTWGDARYALSGHTHSYVGLSGGTMTGALTVKSGATGYIKVTSGDANYPGYIEMYTANDLRRGYIGYGNASNQNLLVAGNGWTWRVEGAMQFDTTPNVNGSNLLTVAGGSVGRLTVTGQAASDAISVVQNDTGWAQTWYNSDLTKYLTVDFEPDVQIGSNVNISFLTGGTTRLTIGTSGGALFTGQLRSNQLLRVGTDGGIGGMFQAYDDAGVSRIRIRSEVNGLWNSPYKELNLGSDGAFTWDGNNILTSAGATLTGGWTFNTTGWSNGGVVNYLTNTGSNAYWLGYEARNNGQGFLFQPTNVLLRANTTDLGAADGFAFTNRAFVSTADSTMQYWMGADGGFSLRPHASSGGWARGLIVAKQSDTSRLGGAGFYGSNDSVSLYRIGFGANWWDASTSPGVSVYSDGSTEIRSTGSAPLYLYANNASGALDIIGRPTTNYAAIRFINNANSAEYGRVESSGSAFRLASYNGSLILAAGGADRAYVDSGGSFTAFGNIYGGAITVGTGNAGEKQLGFWNAAGSGYFFHNDSRTVGYYDSTGTLVRWSCNTAGDFTIANAMYVGGNQIEIRSASPTLTLRDTNHNTAYVHVNDNTFYVLRGANDSGYSGWTTVGDYWPLQIDLTNNNASFGGEITGASIVRAGRGQSVSAKFTFWNSIRAVSHVMWSDGNWVSLYDDTGGFHRTWCDNSGNFAAYGNVTAYSDERLKTAFRPRVLTLEQIMTMKPEGFLRTDSGIWQAGVRAQTVQKVLPETVTEDGRGYLTLNYGAAAMVTVLSLAHEVEKLRSELDQLKGRFDGKAH